ncbi:MAG: hypothetical protein IRY85_14230 [Micromonosporaceae bacterium]|nr:hypothetical protein [Micromonosporaceae bacterium]
MILALIASAALSGCGRGDPDPGGRILTALTSVEVALPEDATAVNRQFLEPHWDSCDAFPGTEGWSDVMVLIDFQTDLAPEALGAKAGPALEAAGWVDDGVVPTPHGPSWRWTRTLDDGTVAHASLSSGMLAGTWNLAAIAPPHGRRASGC